MKRKKYAFEMIQTFMLIILACGSMSCIYRGYRGEFSPQRLDKIHEEHERWTDWINEYIKGVLYVGMPVDEFVRLFTKDDSWTDSERPYIISHKDNRYYFVGRKGIRYRVTFKDGLLAKLEQRAWKTPPSLLCIMSILHFCSEDIKLERDFIKACLRMNF